MDFSTTTTYLFTQVTNLFRTEFEKCLSEIGLHSGQIYVLLALWKSDGLSQIDIANKLKLSPPTVNKMIKSLESNEFVKCSKCKDDGRATRIHLTKKGKAHEELVEQKWTEFEKDFFKGINETEQLIFFQLLGKIRENI